MKPIDMRNAIAAQCGFKDSKAVMPRDEANALCKAHGFATLDEQEQYWKIRDKDLDRIESQAQWIDERDRDLEHESRVDYDSWQTDNE